MGDLQSMIMMFLAGLLVLLVPGLVWATVMAGLYVMVKERVAEFRLETRGKLIPEERTATSAVESRSEA